MTLTVRPNPYIIPEYSLTGDLLSYLNCGLQYRYYNRGALPPATPVQLWFGEFIHGVMEEAYLQWRDQGLRRFPLDWIHQLRPMEMQIHKRLLARGLYPPPNLFCPYEVATKSQGVCPDVNHPHQLLASKRAEAAINTWGQYLFPLVDQAEVRLTGIRDMPGYQQAVSRSNYYGVTGIVDVLSSVNLKKAPKGNLILHFIRKHPEIERHSQSLPEQEYEIIIDYKGMRRPSTSDPAWNHHEWQVQTYAWLRQQQPGAKPVAAGIVFYLNELVPSREDFKQLLDDVNSAITDILPTGADLDSIKKWQKGSGTPLLSMPYLEERSIRIFPVTECSKANSLRQFDAVVGDIEGSVLTEMQSGQINGSWRPNPAERTCTACDFKTFCSNPAKPYKPTVP
jgi:CRISPR/Cas system-associated exonuclease Cas4 (RecB family)